MSNDLSLSLSHAITKHTAPIFLVHSLLFLCNQMIDLNFSCYSLFLLARELILSVRGKENDTIISQPMIHMNARIQPSLKITSDLLKIQYIQYTHINASTM